MNRYGRVRDQVDRRPNRPTVHRQINALFRGRKRDMRRVDETIGGVPGRAEHDLVEHQLPRHARPDQTLCRRIVQAANGPEENQCERHRNSGSTFITSLRQRVESRACNGANATELPEQQHVFKHAFFSALNAFYCHVLRSRSRNPGKSPSLQGGRESRSSNRNSPGKPVRLRRIHQRNRKIARTQTGTEKQRTREIDRTCRKTSKCETRPVSKRSDIFRKGKMGFRARRSYLHYLI